MFPRWAIITSHPKEEDQKRQYGGNALGDQGCKCRTEHAKTSPATIQRSIKIFKIDVNIRSVSGVFDSPLLDDAYIANPCRYNA